MKNFIFLSLLLFTTIIYTSDINDDCYHPPILCNLNGICDYPLENCTTCPQDCCFTCFSNNQCDISTQYCCNNQCISKNEMCCSMPNKFIRFDASDTITISNMATDKLTVYLDITHTNPQDLVIYLYNNPVAQLLFDKKCSNDPDYIKMYLSDAAINSLSSTSCNTNNSYFKPDQPFSIFNTVSLTNNWLFYILSMNPGNNGTLHKWCLFNKID